MKRIVAALLLAGVTALPAIADPGGLTGRIVLANGKPLVGVPLGVFRMPVQRGDAAVANLKTNTNGFFSKIGLEPGRYLVMAETDGRTFGCLVDDVLDGAVTRVTLTLSEGNVRCAGPHVASALVSPAQGTDVTYIH